MLSALMLEAEDLITAAVIETYHHSRLCGFLFATVEVVIISLTGKNY